MNGKKRIISLLLAGALVALPVCAQAAGGITGTVTSSGNTSGKVTLTLLADGGQSQTLGVVGNSASYALENVEDGQYTLKASKYNHVSREYEVTVSGGAVTQDVKLCLKGDVTGDGKINVGDTSKTYSHVRKTNLLKDDYAIRCADLTGDGRLNVGDTSKIYSAVRNPAGPVEIPSIPADPVEDHKEEPIEVGGTLSFQAVVDAGHLSYYNLYRVTDTILTIENPMAYVIYNGVTYEAQDGKVTGSYYNNTELYLSEVNLNFALINKDKLPAVYDNSGARPCGAVTAGAEVNLIKPGDSGTFEVNVGEGYNDVVMRDVQITPDKSKNSFN
jgi:hypothetical protein